MHILEECFSELRYIGSLKGSRLINYIKKEASPKIIKCLQEIAINILYSHTNGMKIKKNELKKLKRHKKNLIDLTKTDHVPTQKKILVKQKGGAILGMLSVLASVIASLAATL